MNLIANTITALRFAHNTIILLTSMKGVEFIKPYTLALECNNIVHLRPKYLVTPRLNVLKLEGSHLVSLAEVTHYSWGSLLSEHEYSETGLKRDHLYNEICYLWFIQ